MAKRPVIGNVTDVMTTKICIHVNVVSKTFAARGLVLAESRHKSERDAFFKTMMLESVHTNTAERVSKTDTVVYCMC